jgi:hypothetical protein
MQWWNILFGAIGSPMFMLQHKGHIKVQPNNKFYTILHPYKYVFTYILRYNFWYQKIGGQGDIDYY